MLPIEKVLSQRDVVSYLIGRSLIDTQSIVSGDLVVTDISRRNHNFKVLSSTGPNYLLKQGVGSERIATIRHEATIYQALQSGDSENGFDRFLPRCYGYDSEQHVLLLEYFVDSLDLREYHVRRGRFPVAPAAALGNALGTLHLQTRVSSAPRQRTQEPTSMFPWILSLHCPNIGIFREISGANLKVIGIIQRFGEFGELLDRLRRTWRTESLIHFDMKWANCILLDQRQTEHKVKIRIVDWELADWGDPCWDVGSVFMEYLSSWLMSIPVTGQTPSDRFADLARYPLEVMQPAIRAFWRSYARRMGIDMPTASEWLVRAAEFSAARLLQTAFEQMQASLQLTGNIAFYLQLSLNMMRRPEEAIVHLLGIPLHRQGWS